MDKIYSFGDVVKAYEGGYEGDFVVKGNEVVRIQLGSTVTYTADNKAHELVKADKKVDFTTAMKAFQEGLDIYNILHSVSKTRVYAHGMDGDDYCLLDQGGTAICSAEILYGDWFIKYTDKE